MCILNEIQIWPKDVILHIFKEIQESSPYIYTFDKCNKFMCVNMYYVMHMIGGSQQIKFGETYAKSAKIRQSGFARQDQQNQKIWFIKPEPLIFPDSAY
jgi:hypothetical protein